MNGDTEGSGRTDTRESEEDALRGMEFLQRGFRRLVAIEERVESLRVHERTSLAGDRDATPYDPIPDQVLGLIGTATDHLRAVQVTVEDSGGKVLAMALFTLVRSAYEAVGTGLWLLTPTGRDERVLRSLRLARDNRRQLRSVKQDLGQKPEEDEGFERMEARLNELRDLRPKLRGVSLRDVDPVTTRLKEIAVNLPDLVHPPVVLWRAASGIAHGNRSMMHSVLERRQMTPYENGSADFQVTTSVVVIAAFYDAALTMSDRLIDLFEDRSHQRR